MATSSRNTKLPTSSRNVVHLLIGSSAKYIAKAMGVSPRTVNNKIARLKDKLGVVSRDELVEVLMKNNFIEIL